MSKVNLTKVGSGYNLEALQTNFDKIEEELNDKVLYRDNPVDEPNEMSNDLDMNSNKILNLPKPIDPNDPVRLQDIEGSTGSGGGGHNAKDFGAVGDGIADDTIALNEWAAAGGRLYLPRGIYRVTGQVTFHAFTYVYGESSGVGSGGGAWSSQEEEASLGASIIAPDTDNWDGSSHVFLAQTAGTEFTPLPSISFTNFKIECSRAEGVPAHLLTVINSYDALYLQNLNLMFAGKDHNALRLIEVDGTSFPRLGQTGNINNVVCIGDDQITTDTPVCYLRRQQEMQFTGLKCFGGAAAVASNRVPLVIEGGRGETFLGCSVGATDNVGIDIFTYDVDVDGLSFTGTTFEDCGGGAWRLDNVTRNQASHTLTKVYMKQTRYQFPQTVAGYIMGATQCDIDAGSAEVYLSDSAGSNTIYNLFQDKVTDNSGNSTNTVITPSNLSTTARTYSQDLAIQRDIPTIDLLSKDLSKGYRILATVGSGTDNGLDTRLLDGTIIHTLLPAGDIQLGLDGAGIRALSPDGLTRYKLSFTDAGDLYVRDVLDPAKININNDIPITSPNVTFTVASQVVGATVRRDSAIANTVRVPADTTSFPINGAFSVIQKGVGEVTLDGEVGVTINGVLDGSCTMTGFEAGKYPAAVFTKIGANEWEVVGSVSAVV